MFRYTKAICRKIPKSIITEGLRMEVEATPFDYKKAMQQHSAYVSALKDAGVQVTELEADETTPDCVFVEDTAVVVGETVLITRPGAPSREPESAVIKRYFEENEIKDLFEMKAPASLDGGDVLFTGHEFFVGLSKRTNQEGVDMLQSTFSKYPVHGIPLSGHLHLKSFLSMIDDDVMVCGSSQHASDALRQVMEKTKQVYSVLRVPDDAAGNAVIVNGVLLCRIKEEFPDSYKVFEKLTIRKVGLHGSELSKLDGALTCCSILY
ncbi:N(G),N(G)-dimethylarginine dimethylaminohydrolase 1-like [Hydractinia symbiolongicarpus]|uniref:N(G),N(G)-dimethylarginine dimethylaminohydrolase 1-like n=1 Tax=Hydractinia symbiolongicarpus TaxID=13093 RepID=UPI00254F2533|nr:N(G),N(G)-dimethylarginine dimethylaminohydrolase 1-like [Hydractinia symbiolongicarpus]